MILGQKKRGGLSRAIAKDRRKGSGKIRRMAGRKLEIVKSVEEVTWGNLVLRIWVGASDVENSDIKLQTAIGKPVINVEILGT